MQSQRSPWERAEPSCVYELEKLSFGYHATIPVLREISVRVHAGEKVAIVGANGAGKSSLLRLLAGHLAPSSGMFRAFGSVIEPHASARPDAKASVLAPPFARQVALVNAHFDTSLSEGQKKHASLSAMLALQPPVILLDEPMNGLDAPTRQWFLGALKALRATDRTLIVATYDLVFAELAADRMLLLGEDHTLLADGSTHVLLKETALLVRAGLLHEHIHTHDGATHSHYHPFRSQQDDEHHPDEHRT